ncbi:hypothetical protein HNY73_014613 [Argiope bruennichi]|uniref:Uncharacterized protein n=1 Tax=Argiope bruennichi TaxID=94029 RepID=A0A8T0EPI5_ARGBR|nr:hypothetical protein HNY73_014613 [Argiope bruennichi]
MADDQRLLTDDRTDKRKCDDFAALYGLEGAAAARALPDHSAVQGRRMVFYTMPTSVTSSTLRHVQNGVLSAATEGAFKKLKVETSPSLVTSASSLTPPTTTPGSRARSSLCQVPLSGHLLQRGARQNYQAQRSSDPGMVPEPTSQVPEAGKTVTEGTRSALCAPNLQRRHDAQHLPDGHGGFEGYQYPPPNAMNSMGGRYQPMASSYPPMAAQPFSMGHANPNMAAAMRQDADEDWYNKSFPALRMNTTPHPNLSAAPMLQYQT